MTYLELYKKAVAVLTDSGCDYSDYDLTCLIEKIFGMKRLDYIAHRNETADIDKEKEFLQSVSKRAEGYPLQYLLQSWTFMDNELFVGEGVLIPRDDTEVCVRGCMEQIDKMHIQSPVIADLCSGSGAIAIALAKKYPDAVISAVELSADAFPYLQKNKEMNHADKIKLIHGNIFLCHENFPDGYFDVVISNPPYIRTDIIPTLQKEVQHEPFSALDGGLDGLIFYRCIAEKWLPKLRKGGIISLEIGEEQASDVCNIFRRKNISDITVMKDIQGLDRAVIIKT